MRPMIGNPAINILSEETSPKSINIRSLESLARQRGFSNPAWHLIMSAIENALEDHEDGTEGFYSSAMSSLEGLLCYHNDCSNSDIEWFKSVGVKW